MADALPSELVGLLNAPDPAAREAAWDRLVDRHSRLLLHVARRFGRDHDAAMDDYAYILEQLREDGFRRLRGYADDGRSKFTTWLVVVARRLCLDHQRVRYGRYSNGKVADRAEAARVARRRLVDLLVENVDPADLVAPAEDPHEALEARQRSEAISAAVATLEPGDRLLVKLRFEDGLGAREIAQVMGLPTPFHVYRRLNTVFENLRAALRRGGVERAAT